MDIKNHEGLTALKGIYAVGSVVAVFVLFVYYGDAFQHEGMFQENRKVIRVATANMAYALLFLVWGGLILGSAMLALKKGREFIEGAILGAFGPLGFIIEVLLPPIPTAHPPAATLDHQVPSADAARPDGTE